LYQLPVWFKNEKFTHGDEQLRTKGNHSHPKYVPQKLEDKQGKYSLQVTIAATAFDCLNRIKGRKLRKNMNTTTRSKTGGRKYNYRRKEPSDEAISTIPKIFTSQ